MINYKNGAQRSHVPISPTGNTSHSNNAHVSFLVMLYCLHLQVLGDATRPLSQLPHLRSEEGDTWPIGVAWDITAQRGSRHRGSASQVFLPKSLSGSPGLERSWVLSSTTALFPSQPKPQCAQSPHHCLHPQNSHASEHCPQWA